MRREPIELALPEEVAARRDQRRRITTPKQSASPISGPMLPRDAFDEAFATLPQTPAAINRIDSVAVAPSVGHLPVHSKGGQARTKVMSAGHHVALADLAAQVAALDRQFEQLSQLLHSLDANSSLE